MIEYTITLFIGTIIDHNSGLPYVMKTWETLRQVDSELIEGRAFIVAL